MLGSSQKQQEVARSRSRFGMGPSTSLANVAVSTTVTAGNLHEKAPEPRNGSFCVFAVRNISPEEEMPQDDHVDVEVIGSSSRMGSSQSFSTSSSR